MAIKHNDGTISHEGAVISKSHDIVRIMSDVWATEYSAVVVNPDGTYATIYLGNDEFGVNGHAVVDAPAEVIAEYNRVVAANRAAREQAEREQAERSRAEQFMTAQVAVGSDVIVVSGRKVAIGTTGTVKRLHDGAYGTSALIATQSGDQWVPVNNLRRFHNTLVQVVGRSRGRLELAPADGHTWVTVAAVVIADENAKIAAKPRKGDMVVLKSNRNISGVIFWHSGTRVGFKVSPSSDPTWADCDEVEVAKNVFAVAVDSVVLNMPEPFCSMRTIFQSGGNGFVAIDGNGKELVAMPEDAVNAMVSDGVLRKVG